MDKLLDFWFKNTQVWFNATDDDDEIIKLKFEDLLSNNISTNLLGLIILHDQISRHIYRKNKSMIKNHDLLAYKYCIQLLPDIEKYNSNERCFILMPLRHTFNENNIKICLQYINTWRLDNDLPIYRRFYQASIQSLIKINNLKDTIYTVNNIDVLDSIYDNNSIKLLNSYNFNIAEISNSSIYKEFIKHIIFDTNIIISISGGVDSMVCSLLLYVYCSLNKHIKAIAVCINYKNRESQDLEVEMVGRWLEKLNIEFHVRNIDEIKRSRDKDREFYEKITRDIRFEMYTKLNGTVILGHNKDDSLENIISNISKRKSYENLLGMTFQSTEKNINIIRPLLSITKNEILEFAKTYSIPFVYDSTPSWSERGKMRDSLIPFIKNFNNEILDGLIELSYNFSEIYTIYNACLPNINFSLNHCIVENKNIFFLDYWKNIFLRICKHYKLSMIKNKSIIHMINNIQSGNRITMNKNIICKLDININIYIQI
jgi:tRNA(Ile)-lysidine synthetase-like protein